MLFSVKWFVVVLSAYGMPSGFLEVSETRTMPQAECMQHIQDYKLRMADLVRGKIGADWSIEIVAKGTCEPAVDPA